MCCVIDEVLLEKCYGDPVLLSVVRKAWCYLKGVMALVFDELCAKGTFLV